MRVLVVGAGGMVGTAFVQAQRPGIELLAARHDDLSIENGTAVDRFIGAVQPDWIINCAGYTRVDQAESAPGDAYRSNVMGPAHLAQSARRRGARLLHISSDYVFDGAARQAYREDDRPNPVNVYGCTKLAGEQVIRDLLPDGHLIVRTQWLFGVGGNFVVTILRHALEHSSVQVVNDQHGRPTYAADLAAALWELVARDARGTVHCANAGEATWFDLATAAIAAAGSRTTIVPCPTIAVPRPARRPSFSVLDCARLESLIGLRLRPWRAALEEFVARLPRSAS